MLRRTAKQVSAGEQQMKQLGPNWVRLVVKGKLSVRWLVSGPPKKPTKLEVLSLC